MPRCYGDKMYDAYPGGRDALLYDLAKELVNIARTGRAWKWAPTWDEAIAIIRELHGESKADERIKTAEENRSE